MPVWFNTFSWACRKVLGTQKELNKYGRKDKKKGGRKRRRKEGGRERRWEGWREGRKGMKGKKEERNQMNLALCHVARVHTSKRGLQLAKASYACLVILSDSGVKY
jgi:hypothetical protein